jgi:hypothetical protein
MNPKTMVITPESPSKRVAFTKVHVRSYERTLGDNPSVTEGPPIGIGWDFDSEDHYSVDEWENYRHDNRRPSDHLTVSRDARQIILSEAGFTQREIANSIRCVLKVKHQRRTTVNNLKSFAMEESMEKVSRKFKGAFRLGKSKKRLVEGPSRMDTASYLISAV